MAQPDQHLFAPKKDQTFADSQASDRARMTGQYTFALARVRVPHAERTIRSGAHKVFWTETKQANEAGMPLENAQALARVEIPHPDLVVERTTAALAPLHVQDYAVHFLTVSA